MNCKVLTFNASNQSEMSHQKTSEVVDSFRLSRNDASELGTKPLTSSSPFNFPERKEREVATQTDNRQCFCSFLLENCNQTSSSFRDQLIQELERFEQSGFDRTSALRSFKNQAFDAQKNRQRYVNYEEVTLNRPGCGEKFGITLCDCTDPRTGHPTVMVAEVAKDSDAARSQKIRPGDVIIKIDQTFVTRMDQAARLLEKQAATVSFLVERDRSKDYKNNNPSGVRQEHFCVSNNANTSVDVTSQQQASQQPTFEVAPEQLSRVKRNRKDRVRIRRKVNYNRSQSLLENSNKDDDSKSKSVATLTAAARRSSEGDFSRLSSGCGDVIQKKSFLKAISDHVITADENRQVKNSASHTQVQSTCQERVVSPHGVAEVPTSRSFAAEIHRLGEEVEKLAVNPVKAADSKPGFDKWKNFNVAESPWVQIARQDYENVLKQLEKDSPPLTDNTSSAYSTGESFRSSSSANEAKLPGKCASDSGQICNKVTDAKEIVRVYYTSSDENSEDQGPECYLTHIDDDSDSEGFEDAGAEFKSLFTSASTGFFKPSPILCGMKSPEEKDSSDSLPACLRNEPVASKSKRPSVSFSSSPQLLQPSYMRRRKSEAAISNRTRNNWFDLVPIAEQLKFGSSCVTSSPGLVNHVTTEEPIGEENSRPRLQRRRCSEMVPPLKRPLAAQRSISCVESRELQAVGKGAENEREANMEWKVRIRRDGTRYITKRPVRDKAPRQQRAVGRVTSDDEQAAGNSRKNSTRDDRKRQHRVARERKRRRSHMQRSRAELLNENNSPQGDALVEFCRRKMSSQRQKRMLLDSFVTVQELLAHGSRADAIAKLNPMLSVTYI